MQMPEGWKRVNQSISEYKTTTDTERMLDMLKEMAEALEIVEETIGYEGGLPGYYPHLEEKYKLQFQNSDVSKKVIETLKNFKEWK